MALLMIVVLLVNGLLLLVHHPALLLRVPVGLTAGMSDSGTVFDFGFHLCQCAGEAEVRCLL